MNRSSANGLRKNIAAIGFMIAPLLLLIGDLLHAFRGADYTYYLFMKLGFAMFFAVIFGLMHLLRESADRTGVIGGGLAMLGCMSGIVIVTGNLLGSRILNSGLDEAAGQALAHAWQEFHMAMVLIPLPGPLFPLGLLVLSAGLWRTGVAARWQSALLALAAILFPLARIPGIVTFAIASDLLFVAALGSMGWKILQWTGEDWQQMRPLHQQKSSAENHLVVAN